MELSNKLSCVSTDERRNIIAVSPLEINKVKICSTTKGIRNKILNCKFWVLITTFKKYCSLGATMRLKFGFDLQSTAEIRLEGFNNEEEKNLLLNSKILT